jgi:putative flippase GtrA
MIARLVRFGAVGMVATATHFVVAVALTSGFGLDPQLTNVAGFLVAFIISFAGQWKWTFADQRARFATALPSYFALAVGGFAVNAIAYRLLLQTTGLRYDIALGIVLLAVAGVTFLLSRYWAFR